MDSAAAEFKKFLENRSPETFINQAAHLVDIIAGAVAIKDILETDATMASFLKEECNLDLDKVEKLAILAQEIGAKLVFNENSFNPETITSYLLLDKDSKGETN